MVALKGHGGLAPPGLGGWILAQRCVTLGVPQRLRVRQDVSCLLVQPANHWRGRFLENERPSRGPKASGWISSHVLSDDPMFGHRVVLKGGTAAEGVLTPGGGGAAAAPRSAFYLLSDAAPEQGARFSCLHHCSWPPAASPGSSPATEQVLFFPLYISAVSYMFFLSHRWRGKTDKMATINVHHSAFCSILFKTC